MFNFFRNLVLLFLFAGLFHNSIVMANHEPSVTFIENKNQWAAGIDFSANIPGGTMQIGAGSFKYYFIDYKKLEALHDRSHHPEPDGQPFDDVINGHAVEVTFVGANRQAVPQGFGKSSEYYNFFIGNNPARWASNAFAYDGMLYESLYRDIDLKVYSSGQNVKYDFIVAPGGDPALIAVRYQGADKLYIDNGNLYVRTSLGDIIEQKPLAFQMADGKRTSVKCEYRLHGNELSFYFPEGFDACFELVIDPLLIFSTYSGSTADNWGSTATPGEHGNLYSAGVTNLNKGGDFPATPGAYQTNSGGHYDIGILKYDSLGSELLFATYLGGSLTDSPHSLIMNNEGELIVLGTTSSIDFATTVNAFDRSFNGGTLTGGVVDYTLGSDILISKLSSDGKRLLASTYVGGSGNDGLNPSLGELTRNYGDHQRGDILTDAVGNIYISSVTGSENFPTRNGFEPEYQGGTTDGLVFKMNPDLTEMIWGNFIGGIATDAAHTIKLDKLGNIFLAGGTTSSDFPVTAGSYQTTHAGGVDGWIAKLSADGLGILKATYTGTDNYNQVYFLDLNADEEVYVYGQTSGTFPVTPGVYFNPNSGQFVQKFDNGLSDLKFSTVFGAGRGFPDISPTAFLVNECNNMYMAGWGGIINSALGYWNSSTVGMTTTPDAFQLTSTGSDFYFIVLTDDATQRLYATFLGGTKSRTHVDGGTSRFDKGGIVYHSVCSGCEAQNASGAASSDFPTTPGAWSRSNNSENCNNAAFKFDLSSLKARIRTNSMKFDKPGLNVVCIPDTILFENSSIGGEIFYWDFGDGRNFVATTHSAIPHAYKQPGQYLVKLKAVDQGTCQVVDSTSTYVTINKAHSQVQDDDVLCFGDSYTLQASGGDIYSWITSDESFLSNEATPTVEPKDTTTYFVRIEETNGCVVKDTVQLNVVPGITPDFQWQRQDPCVVRPDLAITNLTDSLKSTDLLFFDFGDGTVSDQMDAEHTYEQDGVYNVRLVTQREFCVYEKAVTLPMFEMYIPNVITPGSPQHNDVFTIRYGKTEGATPADYGLTVQLIIYNRWGRLVFSTDNYQYDWTGADLAAGVYYYEVTVDGHPPCKSWLQLIK